MGAAMVATAATTAMIAMAALGVTATAAMTMAARVAMVAMAARAPEDQIRRPERSAESMARWSCVPASEKARSGLSVRARLVRRLGAGTLCGLIIVFIIK